MLSRPSADEYFEYYGSYIALVPDGDVRDHLARRPRRDDGAALRCFRRQGRAKRTERGNGRSRNRCCTCRMRSACSVTGCCESPAAMRRRCRDSSRTTGFRSRARTRDRFRVSWRNSPQCVPQRWRWRIQFRTTRGSVAERRAGTRSRPARWRTSRRGMRDIISRFSGNGTWRNGLTAQADSQRPIASVHSRRPTTSDELKRWDLCCELELSDVNRVAADRECCFFYCLAERRVRVHRHPDILARASELHREHDFAE